MAGTSSPAAADRVAELDLLRGFAALLMVFNHVGYAALTSSAASHGVSGAIVFLGSCAPVLFFFATGFGGGLAARHGSWRSLADKVLLLVLADQFLGWSIGRPWTLDFFGFIAVSMIATWLVMATPRPVAVAVAGIVAVFSLRYVLGPSLDKQLGGYGVLSWWIGVTPDDAVSYPAAPWLVYPLLGAALGVLYRRHGGRISVTAWMLMLMCVLTCSVTAGMLAERGWTFHRWGSVGAAFFVLSLAVLLGSAAASVAVTRRSPRIAAALSLGGVASFAVVPLHYTMVRSGAFGAQDGLVFYLAMAMLIAAASFVLSNGFERAAATLSRWPHRRWLVSVALGVIGGSAVATIVWARARQPAAAQAAAAAGQLAIGLLFAWRAGLFAVKSS